MKFVVYSAAQPIPESTAAQLLSLMHEAFPPSERRSDEEFLRLFHHPNVQILCSQEQERLNGFLLFWVLDGFVFAENFAVRPTSRGLGLGTEMLRALRGRFGLPVILEVEPPEDELTRRRVAFYERNGYHLNDCEYYLPCLSDEIQRSVQLNIMSAPEPLSEQACREAIEVLYHTVYEGKPIRK